MIRTLVFTETSPASAITAISSAPVAGSDVGLPGGIAGFGLDDFETIDVTAILQGGTGGVLDCYLQVSPTQGADWLDSIHWTQLTAGHAQVIYRCTLSNRWQATSDAPIVVGSGTSPALAAGTVVQGLGFDRARLLFVAGSSTSAGAKQTVILACQRLRVRETGE